MSALDFPIYQYPIAAAPTVWGSVSSFMMTLLLTVVLPYAGYLAQRWVESHVKDQVLKQWATGAFSAAGKAYVMLADLRQKNPTAPFDQLIQHVVTKTAADLMTSYSQTATKIGATEADAQSRITGDLGGLLAADPRFPLLTSTFPTSPVAKP